MRWEHTCGVAGVVREVMGSQIMLDTKGLVRTLASILNTAPLGLALAKETYINQKVTLTNVTV